MEKCASRTQKVRTKYNKRAYHLTIPGIQSINVPKETLLFQQYEADSFCYLKVKSKIKSTHLYLLYFNFPYKRVNHES